MQRDISSIEISGPASFGADHALFFVVARIALAVADGQILQLAFAALVADRAIQRVVNQQEFHHDFCACTALSLWVRTIMPGDTGVAQAGIGFGAFLDFDQAHAAVGRDRQFLVIAEVRDVGSQFVCGVHHHGTWWDFDFLAV
jgi:hypothetical protein